MPHHQYFKISGYVLLALLALTGFFWWHTHTPVPILTNVGSNIGTTSGTVVHGALQVGIASFTGKAVNANSPIVTTSDATRVTDSMTLSVGGKSATIGFSSLGGGYINSLLLSGTGNAQIERKNVAIPDYGRGWQTSMRDNAHSGLYNPNQAGSHQVSGTETSLTLSSDEKKLSIGEFNVALFQDNEFNVSNIRSEFDLAGAYADVSSEFGIPALQYDYGYGYVRSPDAISQYNGSSSRGVTKTGRNVSVFNSNQEIVDLSPSEPGNQTATPTDLSVVSNAYSIRLAPTFTTVMWSSKGVWKSSPLTSSVLQCSLGATTANYKYVNGGSPLSSQVTECGVDNNLVMLSTGSDPDKSYAVALYYPLEGADGDLNMLQTWIVNAPTLATESRENRNIQSYLRTSVTDGGISKIGIYTNTSGLRSPISLQSQGHPNRFELTSRRVYILFGTPNAIRTAVEAWRSR